MMVRVGILVAAALFVAACASTVEVKDDFVVTASPPPPPPPPEPEPERVEVKKEKIQVNETIHFEFDSAKIKEESHDLLNEIARVINEHPEIRKIRVEGHTDNQGTAKYNLDLSKRRAKAVRDYLVNTGSVDAMRLEVAGRGLEQPIDTNETDEGRARNRRVEFDILERDESAVASETEDDADDVDDGDDEQAAADLPDGDAGE